MVKLQLSPHVSDTPFQGLQFLYAWVAAVDGNSKVTFLFPVSGNIKGFFFFFLFFMKLIFLIICNDLEVVSFVVSFLIFITFCSLLCLVGGNYILSGRANI